MNTHPAADLFPMLGRDELGGLAADIAERGLVQPIVLDPDGAVLDGRNRLAACEIAGVEPRFHTYTGNDPVGFIVSLNLHRRHLSAHQRAHVVAVLRADGWSTRRIAEAVGVSDMTVRRDQATATFVAVEPETVIGKDGKRRAARTTPTMAERHADALAEFRFLDTPRLDQAKVVELAETLRNLTGVERQVREENCRRWCEADPPAPRDPDTERAARAVGHTVDHLARMHAELSIVDIEAGITAYLDEPGVELIDLDGMLARLEPVIARIRSALKARRIRRVK